MKKIGFVCDKEVMDKLTKYAVNGRDTVNIIQTAVSVAAMEKRKNITMDDLNWVLETGRYTPVLSKKIGEAPQVGVVNGLAVYGADKGALLEVEVFAKKADKKGSGAWKVTGIAEEEEIKNSSGQIKRASTAKASVENVMTAIGQFTDVAVEDYNIHINFPGGMPVDGPSARITMFCGVYSAVKKLPISNKVAMTGELSLQGKVLPVGAVPKKILAAKEAGAELVIIPKENYQNNFDSLGIGVKCVSGVQEVLNIVFGEEGAADNRHYTQLPAAEQINILTAEGI